MYITVTKRFYVPDDEVSKQPTDTEGCTDQYTTQWKQTQGMGIPRVRRQVEGMRLLEEPPYRHAISQPWGSTESRMSFHLVMQSRMRDSCCKWCAWSIGGISSSFFFFVFSTISNWEEWSHFALYNKMFCKWAKEKKKRNTYIRDPAESLWSPKPYLNFTVLSLCGYFFSPPEIPR